LKLILKTKENTSLAQRKEEKRKKATTEYWNEMNKRIEREYSFI
jgi:hypothetical protein